MSSKVKKYIENNINYSEAKLIQVVKEVREKFKVQCEYKESCSCLYSMFVIYFTDENGKVDIVDVEIRCD